MTGKPTNQQTDMRVYREILLQLSSCLEILAGLPNNVVASKAVDTSINAQLPTTAAKESQVDPMQGESVNIPSILC